MKISAPGVYDIPIETYHSQCTDGPSISSSGLRLIAAECPAKYWATSDLNPQRYAKKESRALDVGRAAHALVLGEPEFDKYFFVCPYDKLNTSPGKQWNDAWKTDVDAGRERRTLVRADDFAMICEMAKAQRESEVVCNAFSHGVPEQSLFCKDPETGIWLKARPDWLPHNITANFVVEYKTALSIAPRWLSPEVFRRGYELQAALMFDVIEAVMGTKPLGIAHVVQEKSPPYLVDLRMLQPEHIDYGRTQYRKALATFAKCLEDGRWPSYCKETQYFETPRWVAHAMENPDVFDRYQITAGGQYDAADIYAAG